MQKKLKIKTKDGHIIYGTLDVPSKKTDKLIIFVHGVTGFSNEHIFFNAAPFFNKHSYATFRFDLYSGFKKGRVLSETAISTHAEDFNAIVAHFKKKYKKIYGVGHSLGGPSVLLANTKALKAVILWDASFATKELAHWVKYNKELNLYIGSWGTESLIGEKMYSEWLSYDGKKTIQNTNVPVKVIVAENGAMQYGKSYYKYAKEPKELVVIKKAGHTFDEDGAEQKLFQETLNWIKKF